MPALQANSVPPPPPEALQQPQGQGNSMPAMQAQAPAPTHQQTVAALRHFQALIQAFKPLLDNPDLGKADMKSEVIDSITKLVADRVVPAAAAIQKLATFPEKPFQQKQWITQQYMQDMQARGQVLAHHAKAFAGQPPQPTPDAENHMQDISSMMGTHYPNRGPNG